jgi:hypothetical protein
MKLTRVFIVDKKEVPDPASSVGDIGTIQKILSSQFPDILNRSYTLEIKDGIERYTFTETKVGTHG